ncbi:DUF4493 domain-containing protein [Alistipes sp.]|uniref:DUF4493 domain-containing protein n=1 Tax=Alistipes sp. TaxID=1872444 RepID=UPI003AEF54ED
MKKHAIALFASALLVAAGCSKTATEEGSDGCGRLALQAAADNRIATRAQVETGPAPSADEFALRITGDDYDRTWENLAAFDRSDELLVKGSYTARIVWGDPEAEGADKPYYTGEETIEIKARQLNRATVTARVANSQTAVRATEAFLAYFHDAEFTLTTESGNSFRFTPGAETADPAVWVKAGTRLTLNGTAMLQSQTGTAFDRPYTFPEQVLEATAPRTRHTFLFDAREAGSVTLKINLTEDFVEERLIPVELNDGAIPDNE